MCVGLCVCVFVFVFLSTQHKSVHFLPRNVLANSFFSRLNINYFSFFKRGMFYFNVGSVSFRVIFVFFFLFSKPLFISVQLNMSFLFLLRWFVYIFLDFSALNLTLTCLFSTTKAYWFVIIFFQMFHHFGGLFHSCVCVSVCVLKWVLKPPSPH